VPVAVVVLISDSHALHIKERERIDDPDKPR
jgi:hypothetical protein